MKEKTDSKLNDVSYRKNQVEKALLELESRILVVIDDIDRLSNDQIRLVFQLVNAVAGFPNTTYLLSFDKDIVSHALGDVQGGKGQEYLEKIIQVPFDVPPLNMSKLHNILFEKIDALIELPSGLDFDRERWSAVFNSCISPFINTLRDVIRYYNALSFAYSAVKEEVDFIDMAGIIALHIFASSIFEWIRENKSSLIGGYTGEGIVLNELKKQREDSLIMFKEIYPKNPEIMLNAVASLFPGFSNSVLYPGNYTSHSELHRAMRIATSVKFDLYFSLSLDSVKIRRKEVENSLLNMDELELGAYIKHLNENKLFNNYLDELRHNLSRIPENRIELILNALVFQGGRTEDEAKVLSLGPVVISVYTISDMLFRINDEDLRYDIVSKMFCNTDFESFQFLLHLLHKIELSYGRVAKTSSIHNEKLISLEHLYELETIFLKRTKSFLEEINLLDWKESRRASFLWAFIEEESYIEYMNKILLDAFSVLKYISIKANRWSSSDGSYGYTFEDKSFLNLVDETTIKDTINEKRFSKLFWELDKEIIETSAAFILDPMATMENHEVDVLHINEIIDKWEKEFRDQIT